MSLKPGEVVEPSFFDTSKDPQPFWKEIDASDFANYPRYLENDFHVPKAKFLQSWETCTLSLHNNFLVLRKKKAAKVVSYIDLEERVYKIKLILPSEEKYSTKYKHGFSICSNGKINDFYCKEKAQLAKWLNHFHKFCAMTDFDENYEIIRKLGVGGYGEVKLIQDRLTKTKKAGKFIKVLGEKDPKAEKQKVMVMNEIRMLRKLDHPNIVKMHELYDLGDEICIVMEYIEGDRLLDHLTKMKKLYEKEAALIMKQLLLVLNYLMGQDIIHRDIKTENIMLLRDRQGKLSIKLIDFGLGTYNRKRDIVKRCGTPGYVAPEILNNNESYDFKVDLFSSGVILFMCVTGKAPFHGETHKEMLERNKNGQISYQGRSWNMASPEAKDLIQRMLEPSQANRILLEEAITHTWLEKNLPTEERKYLNDVAKMGIPEEKKISNVPTTMGQSSKTHIVFENNSRTKSQSYSSLTSNILGVGVNDQPSRLNSFYKIGPSKEASLSGEGSIESLNRIKGPDYLIAQTVLPSQRERAKSLKQISLRQERSGSRIKDLGGESTPAHDSAKISRAISGNMILGDDETQAPDDNFGRTCGERYAELSKLHFCFNKVHDLKILNPLNATSTKHKQYQY